MEKNKINEIQKEDAKAGKQFTIIIIIAAVVGFFLGGASGMLKRGGGEIIALAIQNFLYLISPFASWIINAFAILFMGITIGKCKKMYRNWDGEDENVMNRIEYRLSIALMMTSIDMVLGYFFFGVGMAAVNIEDPYDIWCAIRIFATLAGVILTMIVVTVGQKEIINFEKIMNPEKKGSVYDMRFAKKWEESCDEAEKLVIYKSSYTSYRCTSICLLLLWLFCVLGMGIWNFGILPLAMVMIVQLVSTLSYCVKSIQLSKPQK